MRTRHPCIIFALMFFCVTVQSNCSACYGSSEFTLDFKKSQKLPINTMLFFTGHPPRDKRSLFYENYIEDENRNRISLERVKFNKINSNFNENEDLEEIVVFKIAGELKENSTYKYPYPYNYLSLPGEGNPIEFPKEIVYADTIKTISKRVKKPTEIIQISSIDKFYDERREFNANIAGPAQEHIFITRSKLKNPYYLLKIKYLKTSLVDSILVKPESENTIRVCYGPYKRQYFFKLGEQYSIQIAPVNFAGEVGDFSKPMRFRAAKQPLIDYNKLVSFLLYNPIFIGLAIFAFFLFFVAFMINFVKEQLKYAKQK